MSEPSFSLGPLSAIIETYPYKQMIRRLTCFSLGPLSAIIETEARVRGPHIITEFQFRPTQCYH